MVVLIAGFRGKSGGAGGGTPFDDHVSRSIEDGGVSSLLRSASVQNFGGLPAEAVIFECRLDAARVGFLFHADDISARVVRRYGADFIGLIDLDIAEGCFGDVGRVEAGCARR